MARRLPKPSFSGSYSGSTSGSGFTKYPSPIAFSDVIEPGYLNDLVKDVQDKAERIVSLEDKLQALQERIELLEDDMNDS